MKSKMRESDIIFRFRHCLAFATIILFLLIYGGVAYAQEADVGQEASFTAGSDLWTSLDIPENTRPVVSSDSMASDYASTTGGNASNLSYGAYYGLGSYLSDGIFNRTCFPTSITISNTTVSFDDSAYFFNCWQASQSWVQSHRVSGSGRFFLSNNGNYTEAVVCSDQPFTVGWVRNYTNAGFARVGIDIVNTQDETSGLYKYTPFAHDSYVTLTNMPIYLASSDGYSGFSSQSQADFSFDADNYDFNNLVAGDLIIVPTTPEIDDPDAVQPYASTGLNYIFGTVEPKFGTPSDIGIFATYDFKLNTYMLTHPEEYTFVMNHKFVFNTNYGDKTFFYNRELTIADILYHNDQEFNIMLDYGSFVSNDNLNMKEFLLGFYTFNGNTSSSYTDGSVISYGAGNAGQTRTFGGFTAGVREQYNDHVSVCKFYYECYFVWHGEPETTSGKLKGWKDLLSNNNRTTQNDIGTNYYPPSESDQANYPETMQGGNITNNGGVFNDGDVIIYDNDGLWTPYTLDQVSYANVKDMFDDIREFIDSTSENSFWGVISGTFSYIPAKIWQYITISVAVICGFAVVRYVLRR